MLWTIPDEALIGDGFFLDSLVKGEGTLIPAGVGAVMTGGYYVAGDRGGALYKRVVAEPSTPGKFQSLDGAWWELASPLVNVNMLGAVGDGVADDTQAFQDALECSNTLYGLNGFTYYLASTVEVTDDGFMSNGSGSTIKGELGITTVDITADNGTFSNWNVDADSALYSFFNKGSGNTFSFCNFTGAVGHYIFNQNNIMSRVTNNNFNCEDVVGEVTTSVVYETCQHFIYTNNSSNGVPVGWSVQVRLSSSAGVISNNSFRQFAFMDSEIAAGGQTVFNFTLGSICEFKGVQVDGLPVSKNRTITGAGPNYTVTFDVAPGAGKEIKLIGFRGAENIQVNTDSFDIDIIGNQINGTGDSGMTILGDRINIIGNSIKNAAYAGIALYGDHNEIGVVGNLVADCSLFDDGQSSPDNPALASVFNGGVLVSGRNITVQGNTFVNSSGTMAYAIRVNTVDNISDGTANALIKIGGNTYNGDYIYGAVMMFQDTADKRIQSVNITDGNIVPYPQQIDLDSAWVGKPADTPYFTYAAAGVGWTRDTVVKQGGTASLATIAGDYVDITLTANGALKNTILKISFWAKNNSGSAYVELYSTLGFTVPVGITITDTDWKEYTMYIPYTDNISAFGLLRIGSLTGTCNFQYINLSSITIN